jgi:hypothetical protein
MSSVDNKNNSEKKKKKAANLSKDETGLIMHYDREEFEKNLPHLAAEIFSKEQMFDISDNKILIDGIYPEESEEDFEIITESLNTQRERIQELCDPGVVDFIRRCDNDEEAIEIIDYMLNRGEITQEDANNCKEQLKNSGLRSFGPKKGPGYYERKYLRTTDFSVNDKN